MTAPSRGRGRPALFTDTVRAAYLKARAEGANQQEAAALAGIAAKTIRNTRRADPEFRAADDAAAVLGRPKRLPHGESKYKHDGCRCGICTTDATDKREQRRANAREETDATPDAQVVPIPRPEREVAQPFPLARAS